MLHLRKSDLQPISKPTIKSIPDSKWRAIPGWFDNGSAKFMQGLCAKLSMSLVVEVGVFKGRGTACMLSALLPRLVDYHAVDNFKGGTESGDQATVEQRSKPGGTKAEFTANMQAMEYEGATFMDAITLHEGDSVEVAEEFVDETVDLVFIDGDHSHEGVWSDCAAWWPKVIPGGWMCGHDFNRDSVRFAAEDWVYFNTGKEVDADGLPVATWEPLKIVHGLGADGHRVHACWAVQKPVVEDVTS